MMTDYLEEQIPVIYDDTEAYEHFRSHAVFAVRFLCNQNTHAADLWRLDEMIAF